MNTLQNNLIGTKCILRTNENEPLVVAELMRFEKMNVWHSVSTPIFKDCLNGIEFFFHGVTIPYTEEMYNFLNNLDNKRAYEIMSKIKVFQVNLDNAKEEK